MKYFNLVVSLSGFIFSGYFLFLAFNSSEVTFSILRGIGAIVWILISILIFKEREVTPKQRVKKWFINEKPKGFLRFVLLRGVIGWGLIVGFTLWLFLNKLENIDNLLLSFSKHFGLYIALGFFMGWFMWRTNIKKSDNLGLDTYNGEYKE